jgi:hypothetical protein
MGRGRGGWTWEKVSALHARVGADDGRQAECPGEIRSHVYRTFPPDSRFYERCVGLSWCSACRRYTGAVVHVPRDEVLPDPLAGLADEDRRRLTRSEHRLLSHLDRLVRQGRWPRFGAGRF